MNLATGTLTTEAFLQNSSSTPDLQAEREQMLALATIATQTAAPLWPLDSAIAVNPLSGFEDQPFEDALPEAAALFGARPSLSLPEWRKLLAEGRIDYVSLRKTIVEALGGLEEAFAPLGPDLNAYNLLVARLTEIEAEDLPVVRNALSPAMAILARWLAAFFDRNAALRLPKREHGLYACLREVLQHDPALQRISDATAASWLAKAPADPLEMLLFAARRDAVAQDQRLPWLRSLVASMPGWAAHLRWRAEHAGHEASLGAPATMLELMALVALLQGAERSGPAAVPEATSTQAVEEAMLAHFGLAAKTVADWPEQGRAKLKTVASFSDGQLGLIFQQAAEASFLATLAPQLEGASARLTAPQSTLRPEAQAVFCIDVRSEPMRRALEGQGRFETLGYAGFFGLPIAINPACTAPTRNQLPVLLSPSHVVPERAAPGREVEAGALLARHAAMGDAQAMLDTTKSGATGFATAEAAGPVAAVAMLARTLAPRLTDALHKRLMGERGHALVPMASNDHGHDEAHGHGGGGIPLEQQIAYARGMFTLTGLSAQTARLVALVGHGGCTTNNAFAASLDCGACGGHPGGPNARLMAGILNTPAVREGLAAQGLTLPEDTWFIAAQHDTTRDAVEIFDRQLVPASHAGDLARLEKAFAQAGAKSRQERAAKLGRTADDLLTGAAHWAEVRPEWGLSDNAAFIIAPRALTQDIDLGGKAFLHSYDWKQDEDGSALTGIMTAPMIVAQWINCQYLFSTIDNAVFGAGDKTTQNVIGGFGVVQGSGGDLCTGLPRQSLFRDDGTPYHTPRRLAVIVEAPLQRVQDIVLAHDAVGRLVENGWINLIVIDPWKHRAHHWVRGDWAAQPC